MPRIHFLDVTNRDGVQTARINLSTFGKTMPPMEAMVRGMKRRVPIIRLDRT